MYKNQRQLMGEKKNVVLRLIKQTNFKALPIVMSIWYSKLTTEQK